MQQMVVGPLDAGWAVFIARSFPLIEQSAKFVRTKFVQLMAGVFDAVKVQPQKGNIQSELQSRGQMLGVNQHFTSDLAGVIALMSTPQRINLRMDDRNERGKTLFANLLNRTIGMIVIPAQAKR